MGFDVTCHWNWEAFDLKNFGWEGSSWDNFLLFLGWKNCWEVWVFVRKRLLSKNEPSLFFMVRIACDLREGA